MLNLMLNDGTARCPDHMDASTYLCQTPQPCLYCGAAPAPASQGNPECADRT